MTVDKITKEIEHFTSIQKKLDKKGDKLFEKATNESNPEKRAKYREEYRVLHQREHGVRALIVELDNMLKAAKNFQEIHRKLFS